MDIAWNDPAVQSAIIGGLATALSTIVATICAALIGKQISDRRRLLDNLKQAIGDIAFLLAVEEEHCNVHRLSGDSNKLRIRSEAIARGYAWSGQFTPGRAKGWLERSGGD